MTVTSDPSPNPPPCPSACGWRRPLMKKPQATRFQFGGERGRLVGRFTDFGHEGSSPPRHVPSIKTTSTLAFPRPSHCVLFPSVCCRCRRLCAVLRVYVRGSVSVHAHAPCALYRGIPLRAVIAWTLSLVLITNKSVIIQSACEKKSRIKSSALYSTAPQPVYSRLGKSYVCVCVAGVVVSIGGEGSPRS